MKIAYDFYGDLYEWKRIYEGNKDKIKDMNQISAGTVLKIEKSTNVVSQPSGEQYLIKTGDTLGKVSTEVYGVNKKWKKIYENNKQLIKDPNKIYAGFYLYYLFTDQDRQEKEQFDLNKKPDPLAKTGDSSPAAEPVVETPVPAADEVSVNKKQAGVIKLSAGTISTTNRAPASKK